MSTTFGDSVIKCRVLSVLSLLYIRVSVLVKLNKSLASFVSFVRLCHNITSL